MCTYLEPLAEDVKREAFREIYPEAQPAGLADPVIPRHI